MNVNKKKSILLPNKKKNKEKYLAHLRSYSMKTIM